MEQFRMEQPNGGSNRPQRFNVEERDHRERLSADEINGQLHVTAGRYEEELEKLRSGGHADEQWLATYQDNLIHWMNDMKVSEGTIKKENEEILDEVEKRLYLLSEEVEKTIH